VRRIGVTAAALGLAFAVGLAVHGGGDEALAHTCSATDKRFIQTAKTNMTALTIWVDGYRSGEIAAQEVARQAHDAAKRVGYVTPRDPSLRDAQRLIYAMFDEYGSAVSLADRKRGDAGEHMHRSYGLANFAREVLAEAQPALAKRGCDVAPLL
jgi:hypothetical protein